MANYQSNLNNLMCLDIFLMALNKQECAQISDRIKPLKTKPHVLMCWDIAGEQYGNALVKGRKLKDLEILAQFSLKHNWRINLKDLIAQPYQALVLTNANQVIRWVNPGFTTMTGYAAKFALNKNFRFLHGENTAPEVKERIKSRIAEGAPFLETIVNYRKNQEEYLCQVHVFPIKNQQNEITHFLALENEVK